MNRNLTPLEIGYLRSIGWDESLEYPSADELAGFIDKVKKIIEEKKSASNLPDLPFHKKREIYIEEFNKWKKEKESRDKFEAELSEGKYSPSVLEALRLAKSMFSSDDDNTEDKDQDQGVSSSPSSGVTNTEEFPASPTTNVEGNKPSPSSSPTTSGKEEEQKTISQPEVIICPHCRLRLDMPTLDEPTLEQKLLFLQCILGQKQFVQDIPAFNNAIVFTFRTLTPKELDVAFMQVSYDVLKNKIYNNYGDIFEQLNRYRLFLQLHKIKNNIGINRDFIELPDGLSKQTNKLASEYWKVNKPLDQNETELVQIEEYMINNVLKTEFMFRIAMNACNLFNRLVAKLENTMYSENFWKLTASPG
jgi:hypothetical protein